MARMLQSCMIDHPPSSARSMSLLCDNKGCPYSLWYNTSPQCYVGNLGYVPSIVSDGLGWDLTGTTVYDV